MRFTLTTYLLFFVDVFLTYIRHCYRYILCSFSNRRVPLLVWDRLHVGVSQEERTEIIWNLRFSNDNKVANKNILVKHKHYIDWTENHLYVRYSYITRATQSMAYPLAYKFYPVTLTFDLWPWKSTGFHILLRMKYVPSLIKIHWRVLILECLQGCYGRTEGSVVV